MAVLSKQKNESIAESENTGSQDEIDKIMSEIEELQQEMDAVTSPKTPSAPAEEQPKSAAMTEKPASHSASPPLTAQEDLSDIEKSIAADALEQEVLKEFSGEGDEPWLEETLATLKAESTGSEGAGVLDPPKGGDDLLASKSEDLLLEEEAEPELLEEQLLEDDDDTQEMVEKMVQQEVKPLKSEPATGGGALAMTVQGDMALKLNYENAGQVLIQFSPQEIRILFEDGVEFKIPVRKKLTRAA